MNRTISALTIIDSVEGSIMAHDQIRLEHALLDWEHEKQAQEYKLRNGMVFGTEYKVAMDSYNRALHFLSLIRFELDHRDPMVELPEYCDASIYIEGRWYFLYKKGPLKAYPYMVEAETGYIPENNQRPLLKHYLLDHNVDVEPWEKRTTHWCVREAIKISKKERDDMLRRALNE